MPIYSHSRLSTFEQCSLKYKYRYIDKIIPEIAGTIESHLGNSIHKTLEWLYNKIKQENSIVPSIEEMISFYINEWNNGYSKEIIIVKSEMSESDYFNKGIKILADYYFSNFPFEDNTLDIEKKILISLDEEGTYKIRGFIDRISYNKETGEYEIHDYKTSNFLPMQNKIDSDRQLSIYAMAIKNEFGNDKNVLLTWHYLAFNKKIHSRRTNHSLEKIKQEILELIKKIESTKDFFPKKSPLCSWCEYKKICQNFCRSH